MSDTPHLTRVGGDNPADFLAIDSLLEPTEIQIRDTVRQFVRERILDEVGEWYDQGTFPGRELAPVMGELGLLGMHLDGYGCAGTNAVSYGLACLELEAGDSGLRSFVSVQGSLAMFPIWAYGSDEQKETWLPRMASGEAIGCFGLTEPDSGSDPSSMRTHAKQEPGGDWILNGSKMWITNGSVADVAVVWARTEDGIRGFVVPTDTPGFNIVRSVPVWGHDGNHCEIEYNNVRVPVTNCHSESILVETERKITVAEARELFAATPGIKVVDDLAAGMHGVGNPLRRRPAIADIVLDAEIALRTTWIVAGAEHQAAEGLVVPDQMAGRRRRQQPVLAHQHRPETVGRGDADSLLDGDIIEVAAIAADHQRLALVALQAVEDRLHEVLDIVLGHEHGGALAQAGRARLLVGEGRGANRRRHRA